jgi:hypothetical protein
MVIVPKPIMHPNPEIDDSVPPSIGDNRALTWMLRVGPLAVGEKIIGDGCVAWGIVGALGGADPLATLTAFT